MRTKRWLLRLFQVSVVVALLAAALPPAEIAEAGWRSLTGLLPPNTEVYTTRFSPDSHYVLYLSDPNVNERLELYSVYLDGGEPQRLSPPEVTGLGVIDYAVTPDSQYILFLASVETVDKPDLYRVPIGGGEAVRLNVAAMAGRNVRKLKIDPNNVYAVYLAEQQVADQFELFSVPIAGGQVTRLNGTLPAGGDVDDFQIDPYLNRVVYRADQAVDEFDELYGVPLVGGQAVNLNPFAARVSEFALNPAAQVVVFEAQPSGGDNIYLYMNTTNGSTLTPLSPALESNQNVVGFRITPDGARVVYNVATGWPVPPYGSLYSVLIGGGASIPLTTSTPEEGVAGFSFYLTNTRVVLYYLAAGQGAYGLRSVGLDGSAPAILFDPAANGETLVDFRVSPNGQTVVYSIIEGYQAFTLPITGGARQPLTDGYGATFLPDGSRVVLIAQTSDTYWDVVSVTPAGGDHRNHSRVAKPAFVSEMAVSPNGQWIVYRLLFAGSFRYELRISDGGAAPALVYLPLLPR